MTSRIIAQVIVVCALCAGCGGKTPSTGTTTHATTTAKPKVISGGYATSLAQFAGMKCGSLGLRGGAAIGRYKLYICAGPDNAGYDIPSGAYVCWGFHNFGAGHDQPAVELNLLDAKGHTIGGHVYPDTTENCQRTLRLVAALL